jgi:hypothetical protein
MKLNKQELNEINYAKARADYLYIQKHPEKINTEINCDCLVHRKRKYVKHPDYSPWVGDNWFKREQENDAISFKYASTSTQMANVIDLEKK